MKVAVVHGHRDPGCTRISEECQRRVRAALKVRAGTIVMSGAGVPGERSEALQMMGALADVPEEVARERLDGVGIGLEELAGSTAENAWYGMRAAVLERASHVVVVTSFWHVPRSWLEWRRVAASTPQAPRVTFRPASGSLRYVPGELVALWRAVLRG